MSVWQSWRTFGFRNIALASHANNRAASLPSPHDERPRHFRTWLMRSMGLPADRLSSRLARSTLR
jgi:hypothetical protein